MVFVKKQPIYIIIPVHNRKQITLLCLEHLKCLGILDKYYVVVVDDGSTDGTSQAIYQSYPNVIVLHGDGNLWWTGAIVKGMHYGYVQGAEYFIWLNDDTLPSDGAIELILSECSIKQNTIVTGQCYAEASLQTPTYGGQNKGKLGLKLLYADSTQILECDCMSGNFVCLPSSVIKTIGYPCTSKFPHRGADVAYTWQAKKAGYRLEVLGAATAVCELNPLEKSLLVSEISIKESWKIIYTRKSSLYPPAIWHILTTIYGIWGFFLFVRVYFRFLLVSILGLVIPMPLLKKVRDIESKIFIKLFKTS